MRDRTVEGTVLNARAEEPARRAPVLLLPADAPSTPTSGAVTDGAGKLKLTGVDPGRYSALVAGMVSLKLWRAPGPSPPH